MAHDGTWHRAASLGELKADEPLGLELGGVHVALYRVGDDVYATCNVCTHASALLSDGVQEDFEIECPLHNGRFDIRTGEALTSPVEIDLAVYPVRVSGDDIEVCLPSETAACDGKGDGCPRS